MSVRSMAVQQRAKGTASAPQEHAGARHPGEPPSLPSVLACNLSYKPNCLFEHLIFHICAMFEECFSGADKMSGFGLFSELRC